MINLFKELKRRNVFRVAIAYGAIGWLLAEISALLFDTFGAPDWVMKVFVTLVLLGFPLALFLSWAYELTPDGIKREHEVDRSESIARQTGQKLNTIIIAIIVIAVGFLLFERFTGQRAEQTADVESTTAEVQDEIISIAVLPFVNMSSDSEQDYFSDGISEEILNLLVRVNGLSVASRTSAFSFKGSKENLADIAEVLGVDHILEGSVRKSNDRVRITAQLIDAKSDRHLWSDTFDRELTDIFAIQDDISAAIVDALRTTLGVQIEKSVNVSVATTNMDAYQVFLKARSLFFYRNPLGLRQSIELFEQAIEMDPGFARAYEGLAAVMVVVRGYPVPPGYEPMTLRDANETAESAARRALEINPSLSLAHAALGQVSMHTFDYEEALQEYDLAIDLDDHNASSFLWRGLRLVELGYIEKSLEDFRAAQRLEPDTGIYNQYLGASLYIMGRHDEGLQYLQAAYEQGRFIGFLPFFQGLESKGKLGAVAAVRDRFSDEQGTVVPYLMRIFDGSDDREKARQRFFAELEKKPKIASFVYRNGPILAILGEHERAADALAANAGGAWVVMWWDYFHDFRQSSFFKAKIREMKIYDYWREHGWPDFCRPLGDDDFECD